MEASQLSAITSYLLDGVVPGTTWAFVASGLGSLLGAFLGSTPMIVTADGAVGIKEGGKTGLTAIIASVCFLAAVFFAPFFQVRCPGCPRCDH
eukprot:scaffold647855_cov38-Prasinocladus_malaysianus.AAC.1